MNDADPPLSLPKIPFVVADALLVLAAIALKLTAPPGLLVDLLMVLAVAVAGILGAFPYYAEYRARCRLLEFDLSQNSDANARRIEQATQLLQTLIQQTAAAEGAKPFSSEMATELFEGLGARIEAGSQAQSEAQKGALAKAVKYLEAKLPENTSADEVDLLKTLLLERLGEIKASMAKLADKQLEPAPLVGSTAAQPAPAQQATEQPSSESEVADAAAESAPGESAPAEAHAQPPASEQAAEVDLKADHVDTDESETEAAAVPPLEAESTESVATEPESPAVASLMEDDDWGEGWGEEATGMPEEDEDLPPKDSMPSAEVPTQGGPASAPEATTLIAQVLIGIGNKPYVRGTGPGLSQDKGVPMEFLEIGKWQWSIQGCGEPVTTHVYKNDETPDVGGPITIEPGQRRSVTPRFTP
jgi:hypothetical protein